MTPSLSFPLINNHRGPRLVFVLGGGGARGALQVGALRYLMEQGIVPDLMVGTSIGAVNATFLASRGYTPQTLEELVQTWRDAAAANLLPPHIFRVAARFLFKRKGGQPEEHILRDFFVTRGLTPDVRYADLPGPPVVAVAADLNRLRVRLYGVDPEESALEGLLASTAVPPWVSPLDIGDSYLLDGGLLSNLPVEPALQLGAQDIIAMDLFDARHATLEAEGMGPFFLKLAASSQLRQRELELALAAERGIPVRHLQLIPHRTVPMWDFSETEILMQHGYELAKEQMQGWEPRPQSFTQRLRHWLKR